MLQEDFNGAVDRGFFLTECFSDKSCQVLLMSCTATFTVHFIMDIKIAGKWFPKNPQ